MDRRRRVVLVAVAFVLLLVALGVQAALVDRDVEARHTDAGATSPGTTLVGVHSWEDDGRVVEVDQDGEIVWEWGLEDSRVFGVERLDEATVLVAVAVRIDASRCADRYLEYDEYDDHCVWNRVLEIDTRTNEPVWEYSWYDQFIHWHEVHDVERLDSGETAIVDMGRDRVFTVDRDGEVTWEWDAVSHLDEGSPFFEEHVPTDRRDAVRREHEHSDWTHMNDVDVLENGNVQVSIRNYDVVIEIDPETDEIVEFWGEPGNHATMRQQHNPHRLEDGGTMLVADSENDRVVELDLATEEIVWEYTGPPGDPLQWPRDADRLPNGNTLVTDSRNNRVLEVTPAGETVWEFVDPDGEVIPLPYEADRVPSGEGSDSERPDAPAAHSFDDLDGYEAEEHGWRGEIRRIETLAHWVLPQWMHLPQQLNVLAIVLCGFWLVAEGIAIAVSRWRTL